MVEQLIGGRYRLLERHAVGGMATLWRARDERTGQVVAVKRLHPYLVADPSARRRLVREAAALEAVDHPSITRPQNLIDDPDDPVLVMEFAEGMSLEQRIATGGPLDSEEAVAIVGTIADALAVAHDAGIVHRDVKPANILVEDSGAVHLVDFGIASHGPDDDAGLTATGTVVGTLRYAAPERLAGGDSTPRGDVWGLGAVLFELLTGRPAVESAGVGRLHVARSDPPDVAPLPAALGAIVKRAMAWDPADRYADAGAFRDALLSASEGVDSNADTTLMPLPAVAEPRSIVETRRPFSGLSRVDRAAAVFFSWVVAVTVVAAVVLGLGSTGQAAAPTSDPPVQGMEIAPSPTDAVVPLEPDGDGSGRGNDHGNSGKGKGKDNDDQGGD